MSIDIRKNNLHFIKKGIYYICLLIVDSSEVAVLTTAMKIGLALRNLRELRNYSLEDVGSRVDKSRKTIHAYEQGLISISVQTLEEILNIYGVSVGKFLDDID